MPLDVKQAILAARTHFEDILPDLALRTEVRVEEIEKEGPNWAVTLSVPMPKEALAENLFSSRGPFGLRTAKVVVVDGTDGKFVALRQRAA